MCTRVRCPTSKMYLTDDEIADFSLSDETSSFRLRIWRAKASPAIVLVSQLVGGPSPSWSSGHNANLIHRAYLGFPAEGMLYFEDETVLGERKLYSVGFHAIGDGLRHCLTWPIRHEFEWSDLEFLVGTTIPDGLPAGPSVSGDRRRGRIS
jgi:hypothetical protein